ncbi:MAG: hypothetical protein ACREBU_23490 [Nitrososphaera sp.]
MRLRQAIASGTVQAIVFHITKTFILPIGMPVMTVFFGRLADFPWFYIWIGFLASLAFVFHWLVKLDEWLYRVRVKDKIVFSMVRFGKNIHGEGIFIGFEMNSLADFPIDFDVKSLAVKLGDKVPRDEHQAGRPLTIPPKGKGWCDSNIITIDPPKPGTIEGHQDFTVRYGRFGELKHSFSGKKQVVAAYNTEGLLTHGSWNDAK